MEYTYRAINPTTIAFTIISLPLLSIPNKKNHVLTLSLSFRLKRHTQNRIFARSYLFFDMRRFFSKSDTVERKTRDFNRSDRLCIKFFFKKYLIHNPGGRIQLTNHTALCRHFISFSLSLMMTVGV